MEAIKHAGALKFNVVAVDVLPKPGSAPSAQPELVIVQGKEDKLHVRGQLRGFLQGPRVQFLSQERSEDEEDRLREQAQADTMLR